MSGKLYALSTGPGASDLSPCVPHAHAGRAGYSLCACRRKGGDSLALSIVREYIGEQTEVRCCHSSYECR